ncbi:Potassium channel [Coemansia spiralis]|nr:Potassium channel [Coemansia spiralis]
MDSPDDPPPGDSASHIADDVCGHTRSGGSGSDSGSDSDGRAPVVTFADPSAARLDSQHSEVQSALPLGGGLQGGEARDQRRRKWPGAHLRADAPSTVQPHSARGSLELHNSSSMDASTLHVPIPAPLPSASTAPVYGTAAGSKWATSGASLPPPDVAHGVPPHRTASHGRPLMDDSSSESSDNEPLGSPHSSQSSPALEDLWLRRARTFSTAEALDGTGSPTSARQAHGSTHTLPRVATVASARGKEENDDDDDLPPMRLGREITNDLRNIQLTFDERSEPNRRTRNPLKHLLRSKHNYRALVTYGGYLLPINILLNIILLGRGWLEIPVANQPEGQHTRVNNPIGYLITSIVSLVLIVASGVCFILRCLEFDVMITTAISLSANFANAALILASAISYQKNERPKHPEARLTGEYYCSYAGAAVALLNALLLLLDILVTPGFRYRGSGMSRLQRMLQFNLIVVVVWIGIGGYVWSKIESWDTVTSVMFCMVTVTTIGYGNTAPTKTYSRVLQLFYGPIGILMFGMMLLNTRNVIMQLTRDTFKVARRDFEARRNKIHQDITAARVRHRLAARPQRRGLTAAFNHMMGRIFLSSSERAHIGIPRWLRQTMGEDAAGSDGSADVEANISASGGDVAHGGSLSDPPALVPATGEGGTNITFAAPGSREPSPQIHTGLDMHRVPSVQVPGDATRAEEAPHAMERTYTTASRLSHVRDVLTRAGKRPGIRRRLGLKRRSNGAGSDAGSNADDEDNSPQDPAGIDAAQTFQLSDGDDDDEDGAATTDGPGGRAAPRASSGRKERTKRRGRRDLAKQLWVALALNVAFWLVSSGIFCVLERAHWSYFDAMWYCYVTFTTIGYGDIVPKTTEGMVAFICLCFVAVGLETFLVVSGVSLCTDILHQTMKRTRVQRRIARHKTGLVAYEIRRHIKHPNYNPFGRGDDEGMFVTGFRRLRRSLHHLGEVLRGKRAFNASFTRHRTRDQRERDERITAGFIRHTTGMGGFANTSWQPPSPCPSLVSVVVDPDAPRPHSAHPPPTTFSAFGTPAPLPMRSAASVQHPDHARRSRRHHRGSSAGSQSSSMSSSPEDILWAFF